jgi:hypothetical protein
VGGKKPRYFAIQKGNAMGWVAMEVKEVVETSDVEGEG